MRRFSIVLPLLVLCFFLGSFPGSSQDPKDSPASQSEPWYSPKKYNPARLFKHDPKSANDQLASKGDLEA